MASMGPGEEGASSIWGALALTLVGALGTTLGAAVGGQLGGAGRPLRDAHGPRRLRFSPSHRKALTELRSRAALMLAPLFLQAAFSWYSTPCRTSEGELAACGAGRVIITSVPPP